MEGDLNSFLNGESGVSTGLENNPPPENPDELMPPVGGEEPAAPAQGAAPDLDEGELPPENMTKREEAIWREERNKRKELQKQVDVMNTRWQQMMERMQALPPAQSPQPPQSPGAPTAPQGAQPQLPEIEIPSFEEDPIGHLRAKNELLERQLNETRAMQSQQVQAQQQVVQFRQFQGAVDQMETQFAKQHEDYHDAVGYMYDQLGKMAEAMGYPPEQKQNIVAQTAMDISMRALRAGQNPAEMAYAAAQRMGWSGQQQTSRETSRTPAAPTSLSSVAGRSSAPRGPSWDAISKMDDTEFDKFWKNMEKQHYQM